MRRRWDPRRINCIAGKAPAGADPAALRETLLANLRFAATELQSAGLTLLLEPINNVDAPGFFVPTPAEGAALLAALGAENAGLQYDIYHAAMMGDDPVAGLGRYAALIRHVQFADAPGRHEPGTGNVAIAILFRAAGRARLRGLDRRGIPPLEGHDRHARLACLTACAVSQDRPPRSARMGRPASPFRR